MNKAIPLDHLSKGGLLRSLPEVISGAEDDGEEGEKGGTPPKPEPKPDPKPAPKPDEEEEEDEDEEDDDKDDSKDEKTKGLRSALQKERAAAKTAERELKKLRKEKEERELAEKSDLEKSQAKEKKASEKVQKLAAGLLKRDIDAKIKKAAEKAGFIDTDDAIEGVDRSAIVAEQDDEDPSDITIDEKTVVQAVKALAAKRPHWIKQGTEDGEPSGGNFGGSTKPQTKETEDEKLRRLYPGQFE